MARDQKRDDSVFDFLYIDHRRINLFLSQFSEFGHLTSITRSDSETSEKGGGLDLKLASASASHGAVTSVSKDYDAQWVGPLTFLDHLAQQDFLERDIGKAGFGQFVLVSGDLDLRDLSIIKTAMGLPSLRGSLNQAPAPTPASGSTRAERRRNNRERGANQQQGGDGLNANNFGIELLSTLPHSVQVRLTGVDYRVWSNLREDSLLVSPSDVFLKHGTRIPGEWNIVGILDARPDPQAEFLSEEEQFIAASEAANQGEASWVVTLVNEGFGGLIDGITPLARMFLGRPGQYYGITPLLIFREVSSGS